MKKNKNPCFLKNWRPISLLNTDYKILAQVFAIRLQKVLSKIISEFQNGYIRGRFIGYNIRTIVDVINYANINKKDSLITFLDFEKAFDQIDWQFLEETLNSFNFGPFFKNVVKTMYTDINSCVINNGFTSEFFEIQRGIRQGCPLSALLFIMAVEILAIEIINNKLVEGIVIFNRELKLTQLADDTTLFLKNPSSLRKCLSIINEFHQCSGLKLNIEKTEVIAVGRKPNLNDLPVKLVTEAHSLGICYTDNIDEIIYKNHLDKLEELEKTLNQWKCRKLTLLGKNTVIKTLIVPKINYLVASLITPEWFVNRVQELIFDFLWDGKPPKIKNNVITNTFENGGIQLPNIELLVKAQKVNWIKRILENSNSAWMQLLYTFLPSINITHLLKCSIDPHDLSTDIPNFFRQILSDPPATALDIRHEMIWFNKSIRINGVSFFTNTYMIMGFAP